MSDDRPSSVPAASWADIRVINPSPNVDTVIVRSIYLWRSSRNRIEFGWKWTVDPSLVGDDETTDTAPTIFRVKVVGGVYDIDEFQTVSQGTDHAFKIRRVDDTRHRFVLALDGDEVRTVKHGRMSKGSVVAGSEAGAKCDSFSTHLWNMEKCKPITGGSCTWTAWADVDKWIDDNTDWWYWELAAAETWMKHCTTEDCMAGPPD